MSETLSADFGDSNDSENSPSADVSEPSERMQAYESLKSLKTLCNKFVAKVDSYDGDSGETGKGAETVASALQEYLFDGDESLGDRVSGGLKSKKHRKMYGDGSRITEAPDIETRELTEQERTVLNKDVSGNTDERVGDEKWILPEGASIDSSEPQAMLEELKEWADSKDHYPDESDDENADETGVENPHQERCMGHTADGERCTRTPDGDYCFQHEPEDAENADESDESDAKDAENADESDAEGARVEDIEPEILAKMSAEQINALK